MRCRVALVITACKDFVVGQVVQVEYAGALYSAKIQFKNSDRTYRVTYDEDNTYEDVGIGRILPKAER